MENSRWKRAVIMAACVSAGSQIHVNVFTDGFIITLAVVLLGIFMYRYNTLHPVASGILVGFASPFFRGMVECAKSGDLVHVVQKVYPDVAFYFAYGCFFFLTWYSLKKKSYARYFLSIVFCDFMSNMVEMLVRNQGHLAELEVIQSLLLIAVGRTIVILGVIICIDSYQSLLNREEHEERYKKLMIMASVFKSEVYFMNKNMVEIEDVMKKAFSLYRTLSQEAYPQEMEELALDISKDVHEIKKDYIRVIKGLQDNFLADLDVSGMAIKDITHILEMDVNEQIRERNQDITFTVRVKGNPNVADHFSLMSILRNLVLNSVDSIGSKKNGMIQLAVFPGEREDSGLYVFSITDNGPGIKAKDMDVIFDPGFSTKFDEDTGDISRGVGLTLVRDLISDKFQGCVTVESREGVYTRFRVKLPAALMEGGRA